MQENRPPKTLKPNPMIRETELTRSEQAEKQLADAGIKLGGYRLQPALGGKIIDFRQAAGAKRGWVPYNIPKDWSSAFVFPGVRFMPFL